ncbi:hypothetical protein LSH36_202g03025 [Paralvinella palmiformis]|uniref:Uncharacterized protein n=1 Tax=Paralvinella palmiformis TaxID=53620 RepID=A0AAD9JQ59_9ANNE|nr:hypothetical protein LSH36_202g03025 [Paralvinella palmiformis]
MSEGVLDINDAGRVEEDERFNISFRYKPPPNADIDTLGKRLKMPEEVAKETADLTNFFIELDAESVEKFVFATAASENHFNESKDGVASAQFHFPGKSIFYYDIGLTADQIEEVKKWKFVEYRLFDFSKYPEHFNLNLRMCSWKPYIIRDVLKETGGVLWMDASIRVRSSNFTSVFAQILDNDGFLFFKTTGHSNYAATHSDTYEFLPTRQNKQKRVFMHCAGVLLIYNTREIFDNVLWWWLLCSYDVRCSMPMPKNMCKFAKSRRMETYARCHKYDQSTINILLSNYHGYNLSRCSVIDYDVVTIERWPTTYYDIQTF